MAVSSVGIERNLRANKKLSGLVRGELAGFFRSLNFNKPEAARDALLAFTPTLVEKYGAVSEQIALDWYEQMRAESGAVGKFRATAPTGADASGVEQVREDVRYAAGHLFTDTPSAALGVISQSVDKYVKQPGRDVIPWNAKRERAKWARVPSGRKTCSFCLVLCSRDAVYHSEASAGSKEYGKDNEFHGNCDCSIVRLSSGDPYPDGYLPKELYDVYDLSAEAVGSRSDLNSIVYDMRRRFPEFVRDGVDDAAYLARIG